MAAGGLLILWHLTVVASAGNGERSRIAYSVSIPGNPQHPVFYSNASSGRAEGLSVRQPLAINLHSNMEHWLMLGIFVLHVCDVLGVGPRCVSASQLSTDVYAVCF